MNDATLLNLLKHLSDDPKLVAVTPDEIAKLRTLGYVEERSARLTPEGRDRLAALRGEDA